MTDPDEVWAWWLSSKYHSEHQFHSRWCSDTSCAYYESYQDGSTVSYEEHNFVFVSDTYTPPNCVYQGGSLLIYQCTICSMMIQINYNFGTPLGHDYVDYTRSTDADGKITIEFSCNRCGVHHIFKEVSRQALVDGSTIVYFVCSICQTYYNETFRPGEVISERETGYLSADRLFIVPERFRLTA